MKRKVIAGVLASAMAMSMAAGTGMTAAAEEASTQGTNTFVDGGTEMSFWTFQELHVGFWTSMADVWNEQNPDRPINLTVTTGESHSLHSKLLIACQAGEGTPDMADIEIGYYGSFLKDDYLLPINDAVEPYKDDVVMSRVDMYGDKDGNEYGVDFHLGASVCYYNMDIMNEAGVDPADIVTWDDYVEAGKTVLEKTGKPMCAVETADLFLPQLMMLEKGAQYVDEDGNPNIATEEHAEVIDYIRNMIDLGICEVAPGGGFHTEEWYGHLNGGGVASIAMPLWYMGRFTDYMPDLNQKMAIYPIPVWNEGDTREVLQGGTGTSVIKYTENADLAKDFLAFAKLSKEGCTYEWNELGFDPIRTELWDDPEITENKDNKFLSYFTTNPFDILKANGTDLTAPDISGSYSATYSTLVSTTYSNAFEISTDQDAMELLQGEQDSIIY
ncbi:MAG: extracellular solute-binding protein [Lachnospiraceae bacterium]|nr:extracellular solute-binding protein [Lachnospiraceae bacterium]